MRRTALVFAVALAACTEAPLATDPPPPPPKTDPEPDPDPDPPPPPVLTVCDEELAAFEADVWRPILSGRCYGCHNAEGPAKDTRLRFAGPDDVADNYAVAAAMAVIDADGLPLLVAKPTGRHADGHGGGLRIEPDGFADATLSRFAADARDEACNGATTIVCDAPELGPRLMRRLTHDEYDRTITALLGAASRRADTLAQDPHVSGYSNHAPSLTVSPLLADQYRVHAEAIAADADLSVLVTCAPGRDCAAAFIREFGANAFRRGLETEEVDRYLGLYDALVAEGDEFEDAVRWIIAAMLQSVHFLYRSEIGDPAMDGTYTLRGEEIAVELAYLLTGGPPDAELREKGANGLLFTPSERRREAERLLGTPDAKGAVTRFFVEWLGVDRIDNVPKDAIAFPEIDDEIRAAMRRETELFVEHAIWAGRHDLPELLTGGYTFVDRGLEDFYGVIGGGDPTDDGFRRTSDAAIMHGLLTQGSVMTVHARAAGASPIHRGKLIRERFLCQELAPPPPGLNASPPPVDPNATARERYAMHSDVEACRACHRLIDPIGFTFETYDGVGRYRSSENGQRIDTSGEIVDSPRSDATFADAGELARHLARSPDVHDCFTRQWLRYAYGIGPEEAGLACTLRDVTQRFVDDELDVIALLLASVESEHFVRRR